MADVNLVTYVASGMSVELTVEKNSPGNLKVVPYTSSALVQAMSSLRAERMPSRTKGRALIQCDWGLCAISAAFSCRCSRSTSPFAHGWYAVVRMWWVPRSFIKRCQTSDSNWSPRSEVMLAGTPKRATQPSKKPWATVSVDVSVSGMASGQRVKRSTAVSGECSLWRSGAVPQCQCGCGQNAHLVG